MDDMIFSFKVETPPAWIPIGRTAENDWRTIEIDCSYWFNMDVTGNVVLMYRPSCNMSPYPLLTERDGDSIIWRPKSGELVEGVGRMQAFFEVGTDVIGSSEMISCEVDSSLLGVEPGTDPGQTDLPWALDIIEQIAVLSGHYPKIENGVLYIWDSDSNEWVQFQGGGGVNPNAVLYTEQTLTESQKAQARENIGAGTYSKPSGGIPASDLASGVIPDISGKANAADVYTKTEVDQKLVGAMDYKGTKATVSALPTSGNETGDVWHITADGSEWAWNGSAWEELGSAVDLSGYRTASAQDAIDAAQDSAIAAKYTKPSGGIPASDLASDVQTSLGKADTALQSHQDISGKADAADVYTKSEVDQKIVGAKIAVSVDATGVIHVTNATVLPSAESSSFGGGS